jgi:hypothetical protein
MQSCDAAIVKAFANAVEWLDLRGQSAPSTGTTLASDLNGQLKSLFRGSASLSNLQLMYKALENSEIDMFAMLDIPAFVCLAAQAQRSTFARATALVAFILIPSLSSAAIYKCTGQDGTITYTDEPCPADTATQYIEPASRSSPSESFQPANNTSTIPDAKLQPQPEIIAVLCANDEFRVWLKAQRQFLPERNVRTAKFIEISNLCRRALHLPVDAAPISQTRLKRVLGDETPASGQGSMPPAPPIPDRPS